MELIWWIGVVWLAYVYAGYPLLLALLALIARVRPRGASERLPSVSVLIAARNEEKDIGWKLRETLAWDYPAELLEVLVASDASEDRTEEIVRSFPDPRVRLARMETRGGKVRALNRLYEMARGELLLLTDANASIGKDCLRRMVRHFADPRVGCVTGTTRPVVEGDGDRVGRGAGAYFSYESLISRLESRLGSVLACDGAIHCVRRSLYRPLDPELANDLELPLRVLEAGYWTLFEPGAWARERETESSRQEYRRRKRIAAQGALAMRKLWRGLGPLRGWQFLSHKGLRWLTPVPMALALIASAGLVERPFFQAALALQLLFYASALAGLLEVGRGRLPGKLFALPFYVVLGASAAFAGVLEACRGRSYDIWEIATLSRGARDANP